MTVRQSEMWTVFWPDDGSGDPHECGTFGSEEEAKRDRRRTLSGIARDIRQAELELAGLRAWRARARKTVVALLSPAEGGEK